MRKFLVLIFMPFFFFSAFCEDSKKELTESQKIVKSRKINKTEEDPEEKVPINFEQKEKKIKKTDEEKLNEVKVEHPKMTGFVDSLIDHGLNNIFSISFDYMIANFQSQVFGFKINFEQKINRFLSGKTNFSLQTQPIGSTDSNVPIVYNFSLWLLTYPFCKGLEFLYFGVGFGTDFIIYAGSNTFSGTYNDVGLGIIPTIGWKQYISRFFMLDIGVGYNFLLSRTENYPENEKHLVSGFRFIFGFKIMWKRLIGNFLSDYILQEIK